jgi:hypothetical protein
VWNSEHGKNGNEHRGLDWFEPPESETLCPVWSEIMSGMEASTNAALLLVKTCINLRSASVQTYTIFHHWVTPMVLVNPRSKGIANA